MLRQYKFRNTWVVGRIFLLAQKSRHSWVSFIPPIREPEILTRLKKRDLNVVFGLVFPRKYSNNLRHERELADGVGHMVDSQLNNRPVPGRRMRAFCFFV
jgi:hypothetical protein